MDEIVRYTVATTNRAGALVLVNILYSFKYRIQVPLL